MSLATLIEKFLVSDKKKNDGQFLTDKDFLHDDEVTMMARLRRDSPHLMFLIDRLTDGVIGLSEEIQKVAMVCINIQQQQQLHHKHIQDLYLRQNMLMKSLKDNALDTRLSTNSKPAKPN